MAPRTLLVAISGVSSSGKTVLAHFLRDILPNSFILHEDDFYRPDEEIPKTANGVQDWDCIEALEPERLLKVLQYVKEHGRVPEWHKSIQGGNAVGEVAVREDEIKTLEKKSRTQSAGKSSPNICIMDGFLLFSENMAQVREVFDVKILMRGDLATTKARRETRMGYACYDSFWQDPPNYIEDVVWPNHVRDHSFLYRDGDVEGDVDEVVCARLGIQAMSSRDQQDMTSCIQWAVSVIDKAMQSTQ